MPEPSQLLLALQHGDSFFPSGATSFSWGLEPLVTDGRVVGADDVEAFVSALIRWRWAPFERPVILEAHRTADDQTRLHAVDALVEAMTLPRELREGSRRAGGALLTIHDALGTPGATAYHRLVRGGEAFGHAPVVQGLVWRGVGLDEKAALQVSAHALVAGILGAALRLGKMGPAAAQRIRARLGPGIQSAIAAPCPSIEDLGAFTPLAEIAAMRHEVQSARLFAT